MNKVFHRRNLPHLHFNEGRYFITYRLTGTIPVSKLKQLKRPSDKWDFEKYKKCFLEYDYLLDNYKSGNKFLQQKEVAEICKETIHYPDGKEFKLLCYCIMPNHVHLIFELLRVNKGISKIMQSIKGISANRCNVVLSKKGKFWQDESYDRWIRNDVELYFVIKYVLLNPVKAGLVENWQDWNYTYCHPDYIVL